MQEKNMAKSQQVIRVAIIEDHRLAIEGIRTFLAKDPAIEVIGDAEDLYSSIVLIARDMPDVAIVDIRLSSGSGVDVVKAAKKLSPHTKLLVLTGYDDSQYVRAFASLGVQGYLLKTTSEQELRQAIHQIHQGENVFPSSLVGKPSAPSEKKTASAVSTGTRMPLTERESQVLKLVTLGLRNREIASELGISSKTVETHIEHVLMKLKVKSRTEAAVGALRHIQENGTTAEQEPVDLTGATVVRSA